MAMRTRFLDSLTNAEVTAYLNRNDVILVPVGTVEMHGEMPLGCEHVLPLAFAARMAEEVDGLVLPGLVYFYPGATAIGRGTVSVSPSIGAAYLKAVCRSLLRQGFRRQVLLTAHGPAFMTVSHAMREFFEETKWPVAYLDLVKQFERVDAKGQEVDFNKMIWGAYHLLGRLDEIPKEQRPAERAAFPEALARLHGARAEVGYFFSEETHHGWWPEKRLTEAERVARAEEGVRQIEVVLESLNPMALVEDLRELGRFVAEEVLPKRVDALP
jgi:creatinine amidohydrolase